MPEPRPAGPILDALGVTFDLDDHDHVTDALVIAKTVDASTGEHGVVIGQTAVTDWVTQLGLLAVAQRLVDGAEIGEGD
ncbi:MULTISPECIES: hypothetical protein [Pseudonocardia]|nr:MULTISPECIES: hypothetical protein [Pseudonocardia]BBG01573.1 hypothetical protein Pdca_27820 [Pseudonocardia autotrophica]GEC29078.1 hypothetical protein PSA01_61070 [Pseudonocardia saturnea]